MKRTISTQSNTAAERRTRKARYSARAKQPAAPRPDVTYGKARWTTYRGITVRGISTGP